MDPYRPITTAARLSLPLNGTVYTTTRRVAAEKKLPELGATMAAELGTAFAASRIIEANDTPVEGGKTLTVLHALIPPVAEQLLSNWEYSNANIGGQKFDSISRTFIYPAEEFSPADPAPASAMPIGADNRFADEGYILVSRSAARSGMQLEPVFKVEVRQYVKRVTMVNVGVDQLNGKPLFESTMIYHAAETVPGTGSPGVTAAALFATPGHPWWGIQDTGFENSGGALSAQWYALTSSQAVGGTFHAAAGDAAAFVEVDSCHSNDDYYWPAVLQGVEFMTWALRKGGVWIAPLVHFTHEAYRGPCATITTRTWSRTGFAIPVVDQMLPNSIHYASPFFRVDIPECLHGPVSLVCDIGNTDPTWAVNDHSTKTFLATNFAVWPDSIIAYDDQQPYRGGYLRVRKQVFKPSPTGGGIA